jgi:hypothetical protein
MAKVAVPDEIIRRSGQPEPSVSEQKLEHTSLIKGGAKLAKKFQPKAGSPKGGSKK